MNDREFDVVVFGATGFTGELVAEYLAARYGIGTELRWAIAGRSEPRLAAVRDRLAVTHGNAAALPLLVADSGDDDSIESLAARTRVVATTVGPYARYGTPLVAACARHGTDYCDLAGEVQWIRRSIDSFGTAATASGARIVHSCGFDSIPSDVGTWALQQAALERNGRYCDDVTLGVAAIRGGLSGGTFASMLNLIELARSDADVARLVANPYALDPDPKARGPDERDQRGTRFDPDLDTWTAPFVMAGINTRVVRRSHALAGHPWGKDFRYREVVTTGTGIRGRARAIQMTALLGALVGTASTAPGRKLLRRLVLPKPGEGPSAKQRQAGFYKLVVVGVDSAGQRTCLMIRGDCDPGYCSTSRMLGEAAVCLARNEATATGGVHTPVSAMAAPLFERLQQNAGLRFEIG